LRAGVPPLGAPASVGGSSSCAGGLRARRPRRHRGERNGPASRVDRLGLATCRQVGLARVVASRVAMEIAALAVAAHGSKLTRVAERGNSADHQRPRGVGCRAPSRERVAVPPDDDTGAGGPSASTTACRSRVVQSPRLPPALPRQLGYGRRRQSSSHRRHLCRLLGAVNPVASAGSGVRLSLCRSVGYRQRKNVPPWTQRPSPPLAGSLRLARALRARTRE